MLRLHSPAAAAAASTRKRHMQEKQRATAGRWLDAALSRPRMQRSRPHFSQRCSSSKQNADVQGWSAKQATVKSNHSLVPACPPGRSCRRRCGRRAGRSSPARTPPWAPLQAASRPKQAAQAGLGAHPGWGLWPARYWPWAALPAAKINHQALGAPLHMYSMASWSPSQSLPFTVSYACHRQSSSAAAGCRQIQKMLGGRQWGVVLPATCCRRQRQIPAAEQQQMSLVGPQLLLEAPARPSNPGCRCRTRHVAERGIDAALRRHGVAAGGEQLGDAPAAHQGVGKGLQRQPAAGTVVAQRPRQTAGGAPPPAAHAVLKPASLRPTAARRPAPPASRRAGRGRRPLSAWGRGASRGTRTSCLWGGALACSHDDRVELVVDQLVAAGSGGRQESRVMAEAPQGAQSASGCAAQHAGCSHLDDHEPESKGFGLLGLHAAASVAAGRPQRESRSGPRPASWVGPAGVPVTAPALGRVAGSHTAAQARIATRTAPRCRRLAWTSAGEVFPDPATACTALCTSPCNHAII